MTLQALRVGITFVLGLACACAAAQEPKPGWPDVRVGDVAVYQETDLRAGEKPSRYTVRVVDVTEKNIVTQSGSTRRTYTREWNLVETVRGTVLDRTAEPSWPHYSFPLEVGKRWNARFVSISKAGSQTLRHDWTSVVEAVEDVTVPAGTFQAFRLSAESHYNGMRAQQLIRGRMTVTYWYAPSVSRLVRMEFQEDTRGYLDQRLIELVSYKPGVQAPRGEVR